MNRVALDKGTQLRSQRSLGGQVDRASEQVFQVELNAKITCRTGQAVEGDQNVDIAVLTSMVARPGAEQRQFHNAETALEFWLVLRHQRNDVGAVHGLSDAAVGTRASMRRPAPGRLEAATGYGSRNPWSIVADIRHRVMGLTGDFGDGQAAGHRT